MSQYGDRDDPSGDAEYQQGGNVQQQDDHYYSSANPRPLFNLAYVSTQTRHMDTSDLLGLLDSVRKFNEQAELTGLLIYKEDSFFQILEGKKETVLSTFARIEKDPRHESIDVLMSEDIAARSFEEWSMAFVNLDNIDLSMLKGYSTYLSDDPKPREFLASLTRGRKLAALFKSLV